MAGPARDARSAQALPDGRARSSARSTACRSTVQQGEFVGLLGTSGSGKSTLLNLIAGLDRADGRIARASSTRTWRRCRATELSLHRRKNVGIIFQSFNLVSTMTAAENVALAMMFAGVPRAERDGQRAAAARVGGPRRPAAAPAARAVGRRAAARRDRARARQRPAPAARRRADRQPRQPHVARDHGAAEDAQRARRQDDHHGHARSGARAQQYAHRTITMLDGAIIVGGAAHDRSTTRSASRCAICARPSCARR